MVAPAAPLKATVRYENESNPADADIPENASLQEDAADILMNEDLPSEDNDVSEETKESEEN